MRRRDWWKRAGLGFWVLLAGVGGFPMAGAAVPPEADGFPVLHRHIDALLEAEGMATEDVALILFSRNKRRFLYRRGAEKPLIAASNAKLATTYAALRVLRPNFRWKTVFYLATPPAGNNGPVPQGLLVQGGGDPTLSASAMDALAVDLKARGVSRVAGPLFFDASIFDREQRPPAWGISIGTQAWFAPVSPFIVDKNAAEFLIVTGSGPEEIKVLPRSPADFLKVVSTLTGVPGSRLRVHVEQRWDPAGGTFVFNGQVPLAPGAHLFSTAVTDPIANFFHRLRASLHRAGIEGAMPLRPLPPGEFSQEFLHAHYSPPLREIITEVNKESNNLTAEVVMRTLGLTRQAEGVSGELGLQVMEEALLRDFPEFRGQMQFAEGSGLSRETRVSASFVVQLLNKVLSHFDFRSEYVSSLALAGWDGTLKFRHYPERMWGRLRAKSGTLKGVQNLSGYLYPLTDAVVFSFLVNHDRRPALALQAAQDRVMVGIFDLLLAGEAPPAAGQKLVGTPPLAEGEGVSGAPALLEKTLHPPPASPKPPREG